MWKRRLGDVLKNADHAEHRRRINSLAQSFVIEADIPASDRNLQLLASLGDSVDRLRKLPHDVRLLRIAKVEAIRRANWSCSRARHISPRFRDRMHRSQLGTEIAPAAGS